MSEKSKPVNYMLYISAATGWMDEATLNDILLASRKNNQLSGLTGMLLYAHNNFVQLLEGEPAALTATYEKIRRDPRHADVTILASGQLQHRLFPGWEMGYKAIAAENKPALDAFIGQAKATFAEQHGELAVQLLQAFLRKLT